MKRQSNVGVFQKNNGIWEYRINTTINGVRFACKRCTDEFGNKLTTKKQAIKARETALSKAQNTQFQKKEVLHRTVKEVYE